ncbi:MAG: hypothetical protein F6K48_09940 [Okeania sp. SIO3H1]|nr:hypothetical protein [Okeania sp. SIO3H1]
MLKKSFSRGRRQETGDNPPLAPPPTVEGKTEEMGIVEEVVGKIVPRFFCHNRPKILAYMSFSDRKACTFSRQKKAANQYQSML